MLKRLVDLYRGYRGRFDFYIAGPMRGYKDLNKPMFHLATKLLRESGFTVWSPAEHKNYLKLSFAEVITLDINMVINRCNKIALLPGWKKSLGANGEAFVAFLSGKEAVAISFKEDKTKIELSQVDLSKYCLPYDSGKPLSFDPHQCDLSSFVPENSSD